MRKNWKQIEYQLIDLKNISQEVMELSSLARKFYNYGIYGRDKNRSILNLFTARTYLESCITILKSMIEKNNEEIKKFNDAHNTIDVLEQYFENFMTILDLEQSKLEDFVKESKVLIDPAIIRVSIKSYYETLMDYMQSLILFPLMKTCRIFQIVPANVENKEEIFEYILFREIFISSKIKGAEARQKLKLASKSFGGIHLHEKNIMKGKTKGPEEEIDETTPPPVTEPFKFLNEDDDDDTTDN